MRDLPQGISVKMLTHIPEDDSVELRVRISQQYLKEHKGFGFNTLNSLSPVSVIVLVFKTCIEALGMKVDVEREER